MSSGNAIMARASKDGLALHQHGKRTSHGIGISFIYQSVRVKFHELASCGALSSFYPSPSQVSTQAVDCLFTFSYHCMAVSPVQGSAACWALTSDPTCNPRNVLPRTSSDHNIASFIFHRNME